MPSSPTCIRISHRTKKQPCHRQQASETHTKVSLVLPSGAQQRKKRLPNRTRISLICATCSRSLGRTSTIPKYCTDCHNVTWQLLLLLLLLCYPGSSYLCSVTSSFKMGSFHLKLSRILGLGGTVPSSCCRRSEHSLGNRW